MEPKTWLITGTSNGFGRHWTEAALERGDQVAALARDPGSLKDLVDAHGESVLALGVDVRDRRAVIDAVHEARAHFGRLDVVVNNAGIGLFGAVEETAEAEARDQFETNFFGSLWLIQAATPVLREQGGGHVLQISSYLGVTTLPYLGVYNATKWAVEGLVQSYAAEVAPFGIRTTLVEPGLFGTAWAGTATRSTELDVYDDLRRVFFTSGAVWADPKNTHLPIFAVVDADNPPSRLFLGSFPWPVVAADYRERLELWEQWNEVARAGDAG